MDKINKFLKWFYTDPNGNEYMTFAHCAIDDRILIVSTMIGCFFVVSVYLMIAYDAFKKGKAYKNSNTRNYIYSLMRVFILCAVTGYGYVLLSVFINPYWLRVLLLFILGWQSVKMYKLQKRNTSIEDTYKKEQELNEKYAEEINKKIFTIDLFTHIKGVENISFIPYSDLCNIEYDTPFDSDGSGVIKNTRADNGIPGFCSESVLEANSYIPPHNHDTLKILKCAEGRFFETFTNRWYKKGEYLIIKPVKNDKDKEFWHDIKTDKQGARLLTYIAPLT